MALRGLTIQEMVQISAPWATAGTPARSALEKVPHLAPLLPQIDEAHQGIRSARPRSDDPRVKQLSDEEAELDARHDALIRGMYGSLSMLAQVSTGGGELLHLRELLFPEGLEHTRKTYRGEAGHAALVGSRLNKSMRARLKAITLHDQSLLDLTDQWLETANRLGELEDERARLDASPRDTSVQIQSARLHWIRVVNALVAMAELAEIDTDTDTRLFAALRAAERAASGRSRRAGPAEEPTPPSDTSTSGSASA